MKDGKISKMQTKPDQVDPASPGQKGFSEPVETLFFSKHFFKKKNEQKSAGCGDRKSVAIVVKINFLDRFYFFGLFFRLLSVFAFFGCKVMKIGGYETDFFDFGLSVLVLCC